MTNTQGINAWKILYILKSQTTNFKFLSWTSWHKSNLQKFSSRYHANFISYKIHKICHLKHLIHNLIFLHSTYHISYFSQMLYCNRKLTK